MANQSQRSFASGELAPALYARTDVAKYATGLRTCRNFIVLPGGGVSYRPGTEFLADLTADGAQRLIKFVFNMTQAYVLAFGNQVVRIYQDGIEVASVLTPYLTADLATLNTVQTGDVMTIVHPSYAPQQLIRTSSTVWNLTPVSFGTSQAAPTNVDNIPGVLGPGRVLTYVVTAVSETTGEESLGAQAATQSLHTPSETQPDTISWDAASGAGSYNVYCGVDGAVPGLIGTVTTLFFTNPGIVPDYASNPPVAFTGFAAADDYPSVVGFYQQRQGYGASNNEPEKVWFSRTGAYKNFDTTFPLSDDGPVSFALANAEVSIVRHLLDLGKLVIGTEGSEWLIEGDANGNLTPFAINGRVGSYNGSAALQPVKVGNSVLYIQSLGNRILELKTNIQYGYYTFTGRDVTVFSSHLFNGYSVVDWDYAQVPNYVTWAVRDDGVLLGFTYLDDQQVSAWWHCDTDGVVENVCTIPEDGEYILYLVVRRTINGSDKRYLERMRPYALLTVQDACFMDAALEYDGRDAGATGDTITLTGVSFTPDDLITMTGSLATEFATARVGDARFLRNAAGDEIVATIEQINSATEALVTVNEDVPADMQAVAITDWDRAVKYVGNLSHLEGKDVSVFADELVVASPNNPGATIVTVSGGEAVLDQAYAHIRVGLPFIGDLETLDIDTPSGPSLKESNIAITTVGLWIEKTRGVWAGAAEPTGDNAVEDLRELKIRSETQTPGDPVPLTTDFVKIDIKSDWNSHGRVFIRQIDPVPANILAAMPFGFIPDPN